MSFEKSSEPCPKCGQFYVIAQATCSSCGLIFAKWEQKNRVVALSGSQRLELSWQNVLNQWTNETVHQQFCEQCRLEQSLPFASLKYRQVLDSDPHSEVAQRMQKRLQEMVIGSLSVQAPRGQEISPLYFLLVISFLMMLSGTGFSSKYLSTGVPLVGAGLFAFFSIHLLRRYLS